MRRRRTAAASPPGSESVSHWDRYWAARRLSCSALATHELTAEITGALLRVQEAEAGVGRDLRVLDLGCGDGHISELIKRQADSPTRWRVIGVDHSLVGLTGNKSLSPRAVNICVASATALPFRDGEFDAVVSFGYASVASYYKPAIQIEVARVLKEGGVLISDFQNMLSLYWLLRPGKLIKQWRRFRGWDKRKPTYFLGTFGVARYFGRFGLTVMDVVFTNCFPPMGSLLPTGLLMAFDWTVRKLGLGRPLGRIFIVAFRKGKAPNHGAQATSPSPA